MLCLFNNNIGHRTFLSTINLLFYRSMTKTDFRTDQNKGKISLKDSSEKWKKTKSIIIFLLWPTCTVRGKCVWQLLTNTPCSCIKSMLDVQRLFCVFTLTRAQICPVLIRVLFYVFKIYNKIFIKSIQNTFFVNKFDMFWKICTFNKSRINPIIYYNWIIPIKRTNR